MKNILRFALVATALFTARFGFAASAPGAPDVLGTYVKISAAFAADDFAAAKKAATTLAHEANAANNPEVAKQATAVARAPDIAAARKQFVALSNAVEPLAAGQRDYVVMYCPMAKADWVQATGTTANPYYGKMMLTCGSPKQPK